MCCLETHKTHAFERIERVVEQFSTATDDEIKQITSRIECFRGVAAQLDAESNKVIELEVKREAGNSIRRSATPKCIHGWSLKF